MKGGKKKAILKTLISVLPCRQKCGFACNFPFQVGYKFKRPLSFSSYASVAVVCVETLMKVGLEREREKSLERL